MKLASILFSKDGNYFGSAPIDSWNELCSQSFVINISSVFMARTSSHSSILSSLKVALGVAQLLPSRDIAYLS